MIRVNVVGPERISYKSNMLHICALYHIKVMITNKSIVCILSSLYAVVWVYPDHRKFTLPLSGVQSQWHILTQLFNCRPSVTKLFSLKMTQQG
jgi:hypothetical protein